MVVAFLIPSRFDKNMPFLSCRRQDLAYMVLLSVVYALVAKLVLAYFSINGNVTLVWFPGGIALTALLLKGIKLWPGIFIGGFIAGLLVDDSLWACFFCAMGNTLETVCAAFLLQRDARFSLNLSKPEQLWKLTLIAGLSSIISSAFGPTALYFSGIVPVQTLPIVMLHWWMADLFGIVTITPVLLIWRYWPTSWFQDKQILETFGFCGFTLLFALILFLEILSPQLSDFPRSYWMFAFMFWGAIRFGRHGVQFVSIITAITALMGVATHKGAFAGDFEKSGLWNYWLFQTIFSWIGSVLALTLHELRETSCYLLASKQRLQNIINTSPVAYALNDDQSNITLLNPAFIKTFGYTKNEIPTVNDWLQKAYPDSEYRESVQSRWQNAVDLANTNGHAFQPLELNIQCKNGEIKHVLASVEPMEGTFPGENLITLLDLTAQFQTNKAIINSNILLQTILETIPLRVFWKDKDSRYLGSNLLFAKDAGLNSVQELVGKTDFNLAWWEQAAFYQNDDQQVMHSDQSRLNYETPQTTSSGEKIWLRSSLLPLHNSEQKVIGVVGIYEDISIRKRLDDQLLWRTAFLEALLDSSAYGILAVDSEDNKLLQNQRLADLWGIPDEIANQPNDAKQLEFVKNKLNNPDAFLEKVAFLYANPEITSHDEVELNDGTILDRYSAPVRDRLGHYYGRIWHFNDITEFRRTQRFLQEKDFYQRALLDNFPFTVWLKDKDCRYLAANQAFAQAFDINVEAILGKTDFDIFPADIAKSYQADDKEVMANKCRKNIEEKVLNAGRFIWMETYKAPLLDDEDKVLGTVGFARDISERKISEEALKLAALVFENSSEAMLVTDANNHILNVNAAFTKMTGYSTQDVIGKTPNILSSGEHDQAFYESMWNSINTTGSWHGEIKNRRKNGEIYIEEIFINTIFDSVNQPLQRVALFSDVTQRKQSEEQIWRQANFDPLTGLPNRHMLRERVELEIKKAHRMQHCFSLLMIDLDRFKEVNDTLGHEMGDELLQQAAQRLSACVRDSDTVARLGGDEFTIILSDVESCESSERVAKQLVQELSQPFTLRNQQVYVSASIGITLYPDDGLELSQLLRNADQAMYAAKNKGRNCFSFFTHSMQTVLNARASMINDLRGALTRNEFTLMYQPIVDLVSGQIYKAEALLRWLHPTRGLVSPADFIPLAEESGLINEIGDWVFITAIQQVNEWRKILHPDFQISVNKSPLQFLDNRHNPIDWVQRLEFEKLPGQSIVVEITEGLLLEANKKIIEHLLVFRDAGVQVAIDDFGTGYSALSYLKKFDIDYLKIDQSFVRNLSAVGSSDFVLCEAIIVMAHKLGLKVIAEGVETELQRDLLSSIGCDFGQGYLFAKPISAKDFENRFKVNL